MWLPLPLLWAVLVPANSSIHHWDTTVVLHMEITSTKTLVSCPRGLGTRLLRLVSWWNKYTASSSDKPSSAWVLDLFLDTVVMFVFISLLHMYSLYDLNPKVATLEEESLAHLWRLCLNLCGTSLASSTWTVPEVGKESHGQWHSLCASEMVVLQCSFCDPHVSGNPLHDPGSDRIGATERNRSALSMSCDCSLRLRHTQYP